MSFSKMEELARQVVLEAEGDVSLEEIWAGTGREQTPHWRSKACALMRIVCLKSEIALPRIERKSGLGRGAKATYGRKD